MNTTRLPKAMVFGLALFVLVFGKASPSSAQELRVSTETKSEATCFVIRGLAQPDLASVVVRLAKLKSKSPGVLGKTIVEGEAVVFKPRFALLPNRYIVEVTPNPGAQPIEVAIELAAEQNVPTKVEAVYPSSNELPANTLKFYVHFSAPMRKGDIYQFVHLNRLEENGTDAKEVELPFLEIEQEFWSRDSKRLTLLLDPGRIKRGLKPREEMGPILEEGGSYELVIDANWADATGARLTDSFSKRFRVAADDFEQPDPTKWKFDKPQAQSDKPLLITFPRPLDHAMLQSAIQVVNPDDETIEGTVSVSDQERKLSFKPARKWQSGKYKLLINQNLEDNSGNSIGRPFDVDVFQKTGSSIEAPTELEFQIAN